MRQRPLRKLILDLTPLIDMITILMFGVMIHAVEVSKQEEVKAGDAVERSHADRAALKETGERSKYLAEVKEQLEERLKELEARLKLSEEKRQELERQLERDRRELAEALARLLGGLEGENLRKLLADQDVSRSGLGRMLAALKEAEKDPGAAYKALRRIEEMEKVFTFIDLHLDGNDVLHLGFNGKELDQIAMRGQSAQGVENALRGRLQAPDFTKVVLFLYSVEGKARDKTVREVEQGIKNLREHYEAKFSPGQQFRYAAVGVVEHAPPTLRP